ncbi:MAG: OmcA/MtrC family decaheme c-type cytochrome, partial [Gammaproteobacteria bacterium]|nr:OmcA/MtrC family decaheme c-type cytochrome [Gammaproteobacteria bacterium]
MIKHLSVIREICILVAATALTFTLSGCSDGSDGSQGAPGEPGQGIASVSDAKGLVIDITSVTINSAPVVNFTVKNQDGVAVSGFSESDLRFNIAKLVPGTPSKWQNYINRFSGGTMQGSQERLRSGYPWGTLVDNKNGTFVYTFATDITDPAANPCPGPCTDVEGNALNISYQSGLVHRVTVQQGNSSYPLYNAIYDFIPAGGTVADAREIVKTATCNECHNVLRIHGSRIETRLCVTCHNPGTWSAGTPNQTADFKVMIHKIHRGEFLPSVEAGTPYEIGGHDYSTVIFPFSAVALGDTRSCTKCHDGTTGASNQTAQGDNWKTQFSKQACGSCHDDVYFGASPDPLKPYETVSHSALSG